MKGLYHYIYYLWYRLARRSNHPYPHDYAALILAMTEVFLIINVAKALTFTEFVKVLEPQWRISVWFLVLICAAIFSMGNLAYFNRKHRYNTIVEGYDKPENSEKIDFGLHTTIVVGVATILLIGVYFMPVRFE